MQAFPRIKDVERITLRVPFTPRCQPWNALLVRQWQIVEVTRITTDVPDLVGYGETLPHYTWGRVSEAAVARVKGRNPAEFLGDDTLGAGLQMAIYDLVGKALGVPVQRLFNLPRVRSWCPIAWWNTKMPPEVLAEEAKEALAQGYTTHKFKARPWFDVYAQVEAISAVTPPHYRVDVDWNSMLLDAGNAAPVLQELDTYERVAIYEGPIPQTDIEGYQHLRRKTNRPLATHFGSPPFPTAVRQEMCDGFVLCSGISGVLRAGLLAGEFGKPFWLQLVGTGLTTALMAHLGAVLPLARWPAITCMNNYSDDLLAEPLTIRGGYVEVPDGPGLGVRIDESALTRYQMAPPYEIPEPRHLLTVVWPGGREAHYTSMADQCWPDFLAGNHPVQERGVRLEVSVDDGTTAWQERYEQTRRAPGQPAGK